MALKMSVVKIVTATFFLGHQNYWQPPKQFDHQPKKMPIILYTDLLSMNFACGEPSAGTFYDGIDIIQGCARIYGKDCIIILPFKYQVSASDEEGVWRHERAHCNGWVHPTSYHPKKKTSDIRS